MKIKLKKVNIRNILDKIFAQRNLFLMIFFGVLLILNFSAIYEEVYVKMNYLNYSEVLTTLDGKRESMIIGKITENLKLREERIQKELMREHKNIFIYDLPDISSQQDQTAYKIESMVGEVSESMSINEISGSDLDISDDFEKNVSGINNGAETSEKPVTPQ